MHNRQHSADAEVDKPQGREEARQLTVIDVEYVQRSSHCQKAKACEHPSRSGLHIHRAATSLCPKNKVIQRECRLQGESELRGMSDDTLLALMRGMTLFAGSFALRKIPASAILQMQL
jgi:hypothetical protein